MPEKNSLRSIELITEQQPESKASEQIPAKEQEQKTETAIYVSQLKEFLKDKMKESGVELAVNFTSSIVDVVNDKFFQDLEKLNKEELESYTSKHAISLSYGFAVKSLIGLFIDCKDKDKRNVKNIIPNLLQNAAIIGIIHALEYYRQNDGNSPFASDLRYAIAPIALTSGLVVNLITDQIITNFCIKKNELTTTHPENMRNAKTPKDYLDQTSGGNVSAEQPTIRNILNPHPANVNSANLLDPRPINKSITRSSYPVQENKNEKPELN